MSKSIPKVQESETTPSRHLKLKQRLTIPLISMAHLPLLVARILSDPYQDEKITALGKDSAIAPTVVKIFNLDTQEEALLVVNVLIASAFERAGKPLVGRLFRFVGGEVRDGKRYRDIDVCEMEEFDPGQESCT